MNGRKLIIIGLLFLVAGILGIITGCARKEKKVNILVAVPLTGDAASYGQIQQEGIQIALDELSTDPVVDNINVIFQDTKLNPKEAVSVLKLEIARTSVSVVFSISTGEVLALAPICNREKIVLLSPLASGDKITEAGEYVYRVSPTDSYQGIQLARIVREAGNLTAGVLYVNDAWGSGLASKFGSVFSEGGGELLVEEACNPGETNLRSQLAKIAQKNPSAIVLIVHPGEAIPALKQIRELGIKARIYGGDTFSHKTIYTEAQDVAQGVVFTLPTQPDNEVFREFSKSYKAKYKAVADINAAAAYDAVMLVVKAIEEGATDGPSIKARFDSWEEDYLGATGLIRWDKNGDVISKSYSAYVIKGDSYEEIK